MSPLPLIGFDRPLALIAGPCVIESEEHVQFLAREIGRIAGPFIFKASFDKANRSSIGSYRGPGLKEGLRILAGVKKAGYAVLTDIAGAEVEPVGVPQRAAEMAAEVEPAPIAEQRLGRCWAHRDKP